VGTNPLISTRSKCQQNTSWGGCELLVPTGVSPTIAGHSRRTCEIALLRPGKMHPDSELPRTTAAKRPQHVPAGILSRRALSFFLRNAFARRGPNGQGHHQHGGKPTHRAHAVHNNLTQTRSPQVVRPPPRGSSFRAPRRKRGRELPARAQARLCRWGNVQPPTCVMAPKSSRYCTITKTRLRKSTDEEEETRGKLESCATVRLRKQKCPAIGVPGYGPAPKTEVSASRRTAHRG
jgi:hypothetical protein